MTNASCRVFIFCFLAALIVAGAVPAGAGTTGTLAGKQTAYGAEFLLTLGNPQKDGFSALFSYTYSRIRYGSLPNGSTLLSPAVGAIQLYNSFTKACAGAASSTSAAAPCGVFGPSHAFPCYDPTNGSGLTSCTAADVANPYYNAPMQQLLDPNGSYPTYHVVPTGTQLSSASYGIPHNVTVAVTYHHQRWNVTPLFQFIAGSRYGAPEQQIGVDPSTCAPLSGTTAMDHATSTAQPAPAHHTMRRRAQTRSSSPISLAGSLTRPVHSSSPHISACMRKSRTMFRHAPPRI